MENGKLVASEASRNVRGLLALWQAFEESPKREPPPHAATANCAMLVIVHRRRLPLMRSFGKLRMTGWICALEIFH
jgi:hypothetical protein